MDDERNDQARKPRDADLDRPTLSSKPLPRLVLASASPRRAEILQRAGWEFDAFPVDVDETRQAGEDAVTYVERVARQKAEAAASRKDNRIITGADTIVLIDGEILGKPQDTDDARRMLRLLQSRWHQVLTGICIVNCDSAESAVAHESTEVKFAPMTDDEIDWYVATTEPMDKAGAYAIQGLGARFIEGIRGDYLNVVGLPLRLLYKLVLGARLTGNVRS